MSEIHDRQRPISSRVVIRQDEKALVYLTEAPELNLRCELTEGTVLSPECQTFLCRVRISEAVPAAYLSVDKRLPWKQMLGEAMGLAINGELNTAEEVLADARAYLGDRAGEAARMWYVQASMALIVLLLLLYGIADLALTAASPSAAKDASGWSMGEDEVYTSKIILLAMICGAIGAGFSILVRIGKLNIDPAAGQRAHYGEVLFRLTIGGLAGFIIITGWQAEVFATFMKSEPQIVSDAAPDTELPVADKPDSASAEKEAIRASKNSFRADFWTMTILALVAGASERMVPSLLRQLSDRTADE